jgi:hypothetical protein
MVRVIHLRPESGGVAVDVYRQLSPAPVACKTDRALLVDLRPAASMICPAPRRRRLTWNLAWLNLVRVMDWSIPPWRSLIHCQIQICPERSFS